LKSLCVSLAYPAWVLGKDPTRKIICASYSQELSRDLAGNCRNVIKSAWYRELFPDTHLSRDTDRELRTSQGGFRFATSLGGTLTGRGASDIILDDPMNPSEAMSVVERRKVLDWYQSTLYSRLNSKSDDVIIIIMQRLHQDDLVGQVMELDDWTHLNIPAIAPEDAIYDLGRGRTHRRAKGAVLHEARENQATLDHTRQTMGTLTFNSQYLQLPVPAEGNLIKAAWFRYYETPPERDSLELIVQSWDTAIEVGNTNDYSVCTTWGVSCNHLYLLDVDRNRLVYPDLLRRIILLYGRSKPHHVLVERAGSGYQILQEFHRNKQIKLTPIPAQGDKINRAAAQTAKIEAGLVYLPREADWLPEFQHEVCAFPNGRHDDQVDSLVHFLSWYERHRPPTGPNGRPKLGPRKNIIRR
jgi:predicted phage terminase large subunit-like protein